MIAKNTVQILVIIFLSLGGTNTWGQACNFCTITIKGDENQVGGDAVDGSVICLTEGTRTLSTKLKYASVTICIETGAAWNGGFQGYDAAKATTIDVYGTRNNSMTFNFNNEDSKLNVYSGGTYSSTSQITMTGSITNEGTINAPFYIRNSGKFSNSGSYSGRITIINSGNFSNSGTVFSEQIFISSYGNLTNQGSINSKVVLYNESTYSNSGTHDGDLSLNDLSTYSNSGTHDGNLDIRDLVIVNNSGVMRIPYLAINPYESGTSFTSTNVLTVASGQYATGTINFSGTVNFQQRIIFSEPGTFVSFLNGGNSTINGSLELIRGARMSVLNSSDLTPKTNLNINQGITIKNGVLDIGSNTIVNVSEDLLLDPPYGTVPDPPITVNISGEYNGRSILPYNSNDAVQLNFLNDSKINLTNDLIVNDYPLIASGNSQVTVGGQFYITEYERPTSVEFADNSTLIVQGITDVEANLTFNDNSKATFYNDVNIADIPSALLSVNDNGDVLITENLTKPQGSAGIISVKNNGLLVICSERGYNGISGEFPPKSNTNMDIDPSPAYYGGCRILPVVFADFSASYQLQSRTSILEWSTSREWGNSHFEIERAVNSITNWETIGTVSGNAFSEGTQSYSFKDTNLPIFGGNIFYRLKQVDLSTNFEYSQTRAISIEGVANAGIWVAFPNPSNSTSSLNLGLTDPSKYQDERIFAYLSDIKGSGVNFSANSEKEASAYLSEFLKRSPKGIYILKIYWGDHFQLIKIIRE